MVPSLDGFCNVSFLRLMINSLLPVRHTLKVLPFYEQRQSLPQRSVKEAYQGSTLESRNALILRDTCGSPPPGLGGLLGVASLKARRVGFDPVRKFLAWDPQTALNSEMLKADHLAESLKPGAAEGLAVGQP